MASLQICETRTCLCSCVCSCVWCSPRVWLLTPQRLWINRDLGAARSCCSGSPLGSRLGSSFWLLGRSNPPFPFEACPLITLTFFLFFLIPILQGDYFACYINHSPVPATEEWLKHSFDTIPWKWVALLQSMNIAWEKRINTSSGDTEDGYK